MGYPISGEILETVVDSRDSRSGGLHFCVNDAVLVHVVRPAENAPILLYRCPFEDVIFCTPAATEGALYLRSDRHYWGIGKS